MLDDDLATRRFQSISLFFSQEVQMILPDILEFIRTRRSIRRYKPEPISQETILELLDISRYAANAHNAQPFRFIVVVDKSLKKRLIEAMGSRYAADLKQDGISDLKIKKLVSFSNARFLEAPVLVLTCLTMEDMDRYPDEARQGCEYTMAVQSVANSIQNLLLIAHSKGLGANWYCAPLFCPDTVKSILKLPEDYIPQAFITLGIPDETPPPVKRKPLEQIVQIIE
jgi:coenzyme F420-0:L-glutamate ligase/coenzyme F420-1:gamma-L-glutamate ligase